MKYALLLLLLGLAPACRPPDTQTIDSPGPAHDDSSLTAGHPDLIADDPSLTTDQDRYTPGTDVQLHLDNPAGQVVGYNLCFSELEQQTDEGWRPVENAEQVCTAIQHGLDPGEDTSFTTTLPPDLPEGRYRFGTDVEYADTGRRERIVTPPFTVHS